MTHSTSSGREKEVRKGEYRKKKKRVNQKGRVEGRFRLTFPFSTWTEGTKKEET